MGNFVDVLVTGAGGFIGGHLVQDLIDQGLTVRAVDIKPFSEWHQIRSEADNQRLDLSVIESCRAAVKGARCVYNLAADMGGMGFIENNKALWSPAHPCGLVWKKLTRGSMTMCRRT
jgi:GDP-D-mannose 3',5'-epimerase